jgi:hypothetical protein
MAASVRKMGSFCQAKWLRSVQSSWLRSVEQVGFVLSSQLASLCRASWLRSVEPVGFVLQRLLAVETDWNRNVNPYLDIIARSQIR